MFKKKDAPDSGAFEDCFEKNFVMQSKLINRDSQATGGRNFLLKGRNPDLQKDAKCKGYYRIGLAAAPAEN